MTAKKSWKYQLGLLLILAVTLIWVASAEVTQVRSHNAIDKVGTKFASSEPSHSL